MPIHSVQYSFVNGEISALNLGRQDLSRYFSSVALCENFVTTIQGAAVSRPGSLLVGTAHDQTKPVRLVAFVFSISQSFMLELGEFYMRVWQGFSLVESSPGVPLVVTTPWKGDILKELHVRQRADVMFVAHSSTPLTSIQRFSNTDWRVTSTSLLPEPAVIESIDLNATITPAASEGVDVLFTASSAVFLDADVDRSIFQFSNEWVGTISSLETASPSTAVRVTVLKAPAAFAAAGDWRISGTPSATLRTSKLGPEGAVTTLTLERLFDDSTDLLTNGDFDQGTTGWLNLSAPLVVTGTHDGGNNIQNLIDSTTDFVIAGVEVAHTALNIPDGSTGRVDSFLTGTNPNDTIVLNPQLSGGGSNNWSNGNTYEVRQTGIFTVGAGEGRLNGGENGIASAENVTTGLTIGLSYRFEFDVRNNALSIRVGSASGLDDIFTEATFGTGSAQSITVIPTTTELYFQARNNQNQQAVIDNVSLFLVTIQGWRASDEGRYIQTFGSNDGFAEIVEVTSASTAIGVIWDAFKNETTPSGEWFTLIKAFSVTRGFPRALEFFDNRFWLAGTETHPLRFWFSATGRFGHFNIGIEANDGGSRELAGGDLSSIQWIIAARDGLLVGSAANEHSITSGNGFITPSNLAQRLVSSNGSSFLQPILSEDLLFFLSRSRQRLLARNLEQITVPTQQTDLTTLISGLFAGGIVGWTIERDPGSRVWLCRFDGTLFGLTFDSGEQVRGWHQHRSLRAAYESVSVIPIDILGESESEQLWVSTFRNTPAGTPQRCIEVWRPTNVLTSAIPPGSELTKLALTVDAALQYDGDPATVFSGLEHREGEEVELVERGLATTVDPDTGYIRMRTTFAALGSQTVVNGQVTTDHPVSQLDVGDLFISKLRTLPVEAVTQEGTIQSRRKRWLTLIARVLQTSGLQINGQVIPFRIPEDTSGPLAGQTIDVPITETGWLDRGEITIEQRLPLPATVLSFFGDLDVEDSD